MNLLGHGLSRRSTGHGHQDFLQLPNDFERGIVLELFNQGFEPSLEAGLVFAKKCPPDGHQMLHGMVEVQPLAGLGPAVIGQAPDPHRAIANDQRTGRLPQPASQRFGVQLFAQGVNARPGGDKPPFGDDRAATRSLTAVIQPKTGAGVNLNPVPAFGFLPLSAQGTALAPAIPFTNVPSIQLDDHLIWFQRQFELGFFGDSLLIQSGAQGLGPFPLATRFPIQRDARELNPGEMFQHDAGILNRHFAGQQRRHVLHGGRIASAFFQAQGGIGGHAPFAAAFAIPTGALHRNGAKARFKGAGMAAGKAREFLSAHRTNRWRRIGFGLGSALDRLTKQFLHVLSGLAFQMAKVLITGHH